MTSGEMLERVNDLRAHRTPFVLATVVRAERPTSAKPGDRAVVLADGTIDGFVGGSCAESTVRSEGLRLLQAGESGLLRITPDGGDGGDPVEGLRTVGNPCLSGGTLEIFLESIVPPTTVTVHGESPVARALARVGRSLEFEVTTWSAPEPSVAADTAGVVVASHGRDEIPVLRAALAAGVPYVAVVASRRRADAVRAELVAAGVDEQDVARLHGPAGLDLGSRTAPEIALSVFAELLAGRATATPAPTPAVTVTPGTAVDPVCGMSVTAAPPTLSAEQDGTMHWFCCDGCRRAFLAGSGGAAG
ncbi:MULTISPECIES: XdhC family protein [Pseudonocardia]|uniref:XdhC family protein n=1 Tax=Pseudonocardia TaxID=1847 RepID=UPI000E33002B|nr:XdhC family protein [Pseudonocardia saturnea]BBF99103.1 hypothetical protein Pdca_03130 [Pseudonocardia autotrophica]